MNALLQKPMFFALRDSAFLRNLCGKKCCALLVVWLMLSGVSRAAERPNIVLIVADDLGWSDLGCYGSEIATPNLDRLAQGGVQFTQFYNCARCCPTRAAILTGLHPHRAGVGHMLQGWHPPGYTTGLRLDAPTIAQLLQPAGYRTYHVGKWHVGGLGKNLHAPNHPMQRGFDHAYGSGGGGNYFGPKLLYLDHENIQPPTDYYITDAYTDYAVQFLAEHREQHADEPFFLHLCYTAPHFPLHAKPEDIAKYRGRYREGWDVLRERRFKRQMQMGLLPPGTKLSPRDPVVEAWDSLTDEQRDDWDLRMAVYAAMIDCMDRGVGRVLDTIREIEAEPNTLVLFMSDNGASAEFVDTWPKGEFQHTPGSVTGTRESMRCLEVGWANAANTPFREHKMWVHEGGISSPLVAYWPQGIQQPGRLVSQMTHVIDLLPTFVNLAQATYPIETTIDPTPLPGRNITNVIKKGENLGERTLGWEHEGNRALRVGDWKLVASYRGDWELYDLAFDRTELRNLASQQPERVKSMAQQWQAWADSVGVVSWSDLPGGKYRPSANYRKKSEPVEPKTAPGVK